jgi:hypothetical protein
VLARHRGGIGRLGLLVATALLAAACETGGLLVVEGSSGSTGAAPPPVIAGSELVNGGNFAKNGQYKLFHVVGQPTPNQNVETSPGQRLNGGLVGAVH